MQSTLLNDIILKILTYHLLFYRYFFTKFCGPKNSAVFWTTLYIVNTGIIEQVFQCTTKMILSAKMIELWTFYENVIHS